MWSLLQAAGADMGPFLYRFFDWIQQFWNVWGLFAGMWALIFGSVKFGDELSFDRPSSLLCIENFAYDIYKTQMDIWYQRERKNAAEAEPEDDTTILASDAFEALML